MSVNAPPSRPCVGAQEIDVCRRHRLDAFGEILRLRGCVGGAMEEVRGREDSIHAALDARDHAKATATQVCVCTRAVGVCASAVRETACWSLNFVTVLIPCAHAVFVPLCS